MAELTQSLVSALADRYRLERALGEGGMATVYLAEDLKHNRKVAIKVLKPELAAVLGAERFVQEIQTTAALQHPNILPLFDSGRAETGEGGQGRAEFLYYVMPYVEGESLRDKLNRESQLSIDEAVKITTEVGDALDYAHAHGIVHRDIKPENILLHAGRPMVADFGIALAVSAAAGGRMTETGMSLGTPHYMSPEQATAEKTITGRSDIYSLGAVLYEMLTGDPPHTGKTAQQIIAKIVTDVPRPVTEIRKSVPANIAAALSKSLEKLPADRFESANAFAEALHDPHFTTAEAGGGGIATAAGAGSWLRDPRSAAVSGIAVVAIAALVWALTNRSTNTGGPFVYDVGLPDSAPLAIADLQGFSVAPDGGFVIYQAQEKAGSALWYRSLHDATTRRIDGTERGQHPAISPDGTRVAFLRRDPPKWTVEVVTVAGGATTVLGNGASGSVSLTWRADGRVQVVEGDGHRVRWFDPGGGATVERTTPYCILPFDLPDSNRLLCGGGGDKRAHVTDPRDSTAPPEWFWTDAPDSTAVFGSQFQVVDGRYLVYLSLGGDLLAAPVNLTKRQVGRSVRMVTGIDRSAYWGAGSYALSRSGTLVYAQGPNRAVGNPVVTNGRSFDTLDVGRDAFLLYSFTPDGRRLAAVVQGLQGQELRIYDLRTGQHQVWVRHPQIDQPVWNARGDSVVFAVADSVFAGDPDQAKAPGLVAVAPGVFGPSNWRSDSRIIGGDWDHSLALALNPTTQPPTWDTLATDAAFPVMSPNGRWVAYANTELNTLWLSPVPPTGQRYQIASGDLENPQWLSNQELAFESYPGGDSVAVARVRVDFSGGVPVFRHSVWLNQPGFVETAGQSYQLTPDGRVSYVRTDRDEPKRYLRVVPNWTKQMERAVDAANK